MGKCKVVFVIVALQVAVGAMQAVGQTASTTGTIERVTVYRGQALVTRSIESELPADGTELIVRDLPANIIPDSIYAQASDGTRVLSVRYRQHAVEEDTRDEVKELDQRMEAVRHKLKYATSELEHAKAQWQMFEQLKDFSTAATQSDLDRGLLTFEPIRSLTALIEEKGTEYLARQLELDDKIAALQKELDLLDRKRKQLAAGRARTEREAILYLSRERKGLVRLELNYLVSGATWQQQYNLRADPDESAVQIEYNAVVNQTSGEDWNGVAVSLSTAEPTMVAAAPTLEPMRVGLSGRAQVQQMQAPQQPQAAVEQLRRFQKSRKEYTKEGLAANLKLNELAIENQAFFFNANQREVDQYQQMAQVMQTEGISVTYELPGRLTLPSRSDQQLVTIASIGSKADFRLVAIPLLTDYVYLQADVSNQSDTILLAGEASIFRNGEFVGRGQVPQVTMGERFTAGFGIDSQVRVRHELEEKKTRIQGGNRIDTYHYRIALSNYKNTATTLRLLDRLPYTEDASIKIELTQTEPALSTDPEYQRTGRKKGILRWDLTLAPHTIGQDATLIKYSFTTEYDRNMQIQPQRSPQ